jgi:hypothetical protein
MLMKRLVASLVFVAVLALIALPSAAAAQGADTYGVGGGKGNIGGGVVLFTFDLSAHDYDTGPRGDFGHVGGTLADSAGNKLSYWMDVDCVAIPSFFGGDTATISGIVKKASGTPVGGGLFDFAPGDRLFVAVEDGGNPSDRPVDSFVILEFDFNCDQASFGISPNVTQGNIVIKQ